jgi:hypothetical protein
MKNMKEDDLYRVCKEVRANLKTGISYPGNIVKMDYLRYGYFTIDAKFSKTGKEVMIK